MDRSKKGARKGLKAELCQHEPSTMVKEVMTLAFIPYWSLLLVLTQAVTPQTPDLYSIKSFCHTKLIHIHHGCKLHLWRTIQTNDHVYDGCLLLCGDSQHLN